MSGDESRQAATSRFANRLERETDLPVQFWDERLTTVHAERLMKEAARASTSASGPWISLRPYCCSKTGWSAMLRRITDCSPRSSCWPRPDSISACSFTRPLRAVREPVFVEVQRTLDGGYRQPPGRVRGDPRRLASPGAALLHPFARLQAGDYHFDRRHLRAGFSNVLPRGCVSTMNCACRGQQPL